MSIDYNNYPQIQQADVRYLWHSDFWDGPRSGMAVYKGSMCWFEVVEENEDYPPGFYRRFGLFSLSEGEIADELEWHHLFMEKVGEHTTYDDEGHRPIGTPKPREMWNEFYEPYGKRPKRNYLDHPVIAWFEES